MMTDTGIHISAADIVFVNPPLNLEERYGKLASSGSNAPPLGLAHLASMCRSWGYESVIIDANASGFNHGQTVKEILKYNPRAIGITASTVSILSAARIGDMIKKVDSGKPIVIGGPHVTAVPEETMGKFTCFDMGVVGEGEVTVVELFQAIIGGGDLENIDGIVFRKGNSVEINKKRDFIRDLDLLPMPAWDLLPALSQFYKPVSLSYQKLPSTSLITSRGCTGKCTFCDRKVFGNACRCFSAEYLFEMVKELYYTYGIRDILFDDDNFVLFKGRLTEFCEMLSRSNLEISWACNARVDLVNHETLKLMARSGCWQIAYGIESGSQEILDVLNKGIRIVQIEDAIRMTRKAGIKSKGFFMAGSPLETKQTLKDTMRLILDLPLDDFQITFFTPLPGCDLYDKVSYYGDLENDWSRMNMWYPVFIPHGLSREELISYSKRFFIRFYTRPAIIRRYLQMLKNPGALNKLAVGVYSMLRYQIFG
jgi:anaerobic magnesium-protoporphyrin IX monomethyl ester cyclase